MKLTGKCKRVFENWFENQIHQVNIWGITQFDAYDLELFNALPQPMKYGVYVDFFNHINKEKEIQMLGECSMGVDYFYYECPGNIYQHNTMNGAREQAILKANEIYNESK